MKLREIWAGSVPAIPTRPAPGEIAVEARGVSLTIGDATILSDVDVAIRAGEMLALVGPNGAGKSSLLALLAGDHRPDSGQVLVGGEPLDNWTHAELAIRRSVLLQQIDVSFPFTVTEIVRMGRAPWVGTTAEDWDDVIVAEALAETDIERFTDRVYNSLSGGERARAAMARVLAQEAVALLLDEPTAALDIRHQELVLSLARARAARGDAVAVVMHDLSLAAAYADVVMLLHRGRVRAVGSPAEVLTAELLSEVYEYPIDIITHPQTGDPIVIPRREPGISSTNQLRSVTE